MNFFSLVLLGISAFSVYFDLLSIRILIFSAMNMSLVLLFVIILVYIKLFTNYAVPGWTSVVATNMLLLFGQMVIIAAFTLISFLNRRSSYKIIPSKVYRDYIKEIEEI